MIRLLRDLNRPGLYVVSTEAGHRGRPTTWWRALAESRRCHPYHRVSVIVRVDRCSHAETAGIAPGLRRVLSRCAATLDPTSTPDISR